MLEIAERPLLTFGLSGYNHARFIENAILGALSQTYTPLEIILSDDHSSDETFQIMRRMAAAYRGPHRIILNRNESNRGIGGNINRIFELAHGKFIIMAAGDDVSLPTRAQINYEGWEASRREATFVRSSFSVIDGTGRPAENTGWEFSWSNEGTFTEERPSVHEFFSPNKPWYVGCAAAWSPRLMEVFGPLPDRLVHGDEVLALRATCLGYHVRIATPLVKYRLHGHNAFGSSREPGSSAQEVAREEARRQAELRTRYGMYGAFIADLEQAIDKSLISQQAFEHAMAVCLREHGLLEAKMDFYSGSFLRKCRLLVELKKAGLPPADLRRMALRLLPGRSFALFKSWRNGLRTRMGRGVPKLTVPS
jgi:GT2 family glycosyltransferase